MIRTSEGIKIITAALAEFHKAEVSVPKTADNPFFKSKYADLWTIKFKCDPKLNELGLVITQFPGCTEGGKATLITRLAHTSGEFMEAETPLYLAKDDPQAQGSSITYMRRYAYCAVLGIVADPDDDGEKAMRRKPKKAAAPEPDYEMVNGEQIPLSPRMDTVRTGPGGVDATPISEAQGRKVYAVTKGSYGQDADVKAIVSRLIGRDIRRTEEVWVSELDPLLENLKAKA